MKIIQISRTGTERMENLIFKNDKKLRTKNKALQITDNWKNDNDDYFSAE